MKSIGIIALALLTPPIAFAAGFSRDLQMGSSGADVTALQKLLNEDIATQVTATGPGSPGNETDFFGPATKRAVIKLQEKYRSQILAPNKLSSGTGTVGPATRLILESLISASSGTSSSAGTLAEPVSAPAPTEGQTNDSDLGDLAVFWTTQKQVAERMGYSPEQITQMRAEIAKMAATTTDLRASFLKAVQPAAISQGTSLLGAAVTLIDSVVFPRHVEAALGAPFGGTLLAAVPCNGGVWNLVITPHSPLYPVLLSYETGTELYLFHNIPAPLLIGLKGAYIPVPMAYCWIGIYPFPSEGMITPEVGSSLLPAF